MLPILKLLLPALLPSWRFFDVIGPSPRVQFSFLDSNSSRLGEWREYRPRPLELSFVQMIVRLFYNPHWNETLYVLGCAEHLMEHPTKQTEDEILSRIINDVNRHVLDSGAATNLQFRLLLIHRQDVELREEVIFHSRIQPIALGRV